MTIILHPSYQRNKWGVLADAAGKVGAEGRPKKPVVPRRDSTGRIVLLSMGGSAGLVCRCYG